MKQFKFSLDTVLAYKQQVLDSVKAEFAAAAARTAAQEKYLESMWKQYRDCDGEFRQRKSEGMTITEATLYESGLRALELRIQRETAKLEQLREEEEKKREAMVDAKIDTSSLEKLKEKKLELYQKAMQKADELLVDEFVSAARVNSVSA